MSNPQDLFEAIEAHDLGRMSALLAAGADPNALQPQWPGYTALEAAINALEDGGPLGAVSALLKHGSNVNANPDGQGTALLMALFRGQSAAARLLLAAGADPNARGGEGDSPLRWAVAHGDREMVELLLCHGAGKTIDEPGEPRGRTALGIATERLDLPMMELLLDEGADIDARDYDDMTARERLPPPESADAEQRAGALALLARANP